MKKRIKLGPRKSSAQSAAFQSFFSLTRYGSRCQNRGFSSVVISDSVAGSCIDTGRLSPESAFDRDENGMGDRCRSPIPVHRNRESYSCSEAVASAAML